MFEKSTFISYCRVWFRIAIIALTLLLSAGPPAVQSAPPSQTPPNWCQCLLPNAAELGKLSVGTWSGTFDTASFRDLLGGPGDCLGTYASLDGTNMNVLVAVKSSGSVDGAKSDFAKIKQASKNDNWQGPWGASYGDEAIQNTDRWDRLHYVVFRRGAFLADVQFWIDNPSPLAGHEAQAKKIATALDANLQAADKCVKAPATPTPTRTATPTPTAGPLGVGHGCSYNEPSISPSQVRCAATHTNALPNANIEYAWKLDDVQQTEKGNTFARDDGNITPGTHTLIVVAKDTKNNKEASSSFTFTKPGGVMSVTAQCAVRANDARAVTCYADVKDAPKGAALTYEWTWNGAPESETTIALNKTGLKDGSYTITVRAKDSASGKTTSLASTMIQVGVPAASAGSGTVDVTTQAGTTTLNPGDKTRLTLSARDKAEIRANCDKLMYTLELMVLTRDSARVPYDLYVVVSLIHLECNKLLAFTTPRTLVMADGIARVPLSLLAAAEPAAQMKLELQQGSSRIEMVHKAVALDVETATTVVTSLGKNTFGIAHDPNTNVTYVVAYEGTVMVQPQNRALAPVALQKNQQVQVTKDGVSILAPVTSGSPSAVSLDTLAPLALGGCIGLIALLGLTGGVLIIARGRTHPARPSALPPSAPQDRPRPTDLPERSAPPKPPDLPR